MEREKIIENIIQKAILKYRLKNKNIMNTYIFSQIEKFNLENEEVENLINRIDFLIDTMKIQKSIEIDEKIKEDIKNINFYYMGKKIN